jgi:hypothetical protein
MLVSAIRSYAYEEVEDLIDLFESDGEIIAVIAGKRAKSLDLQVREEVRWIGSSGDLGAVLTDRRFAVISFFSPAWQSLSLKMDEAGKGAVSLSPAIAFLVTENRAVAFDSFSNRFIEARLPIYDEVLAVEVERLVAVVVTSSRAFGFSAKTSSFKEIGLRVRETVEEIKITSSKATIRTPGRLLTFDAFRSSWKEHRL